MDDNFNFELTTEFPGYISSKDKTNVNPAALVKGSQNVYKKLSGTIANRFGLLRRGTADATLAGIVSSYEWITSLGGNRPLRVRSDGLLQVEVLQNNVYTWYSLMTGMTKTRCVFDTVWDISNSKDFLLFVLGDANIYKWSGGISLIGSNDGSSITKQSNATTWAQDGFDAAGSVIVNGVTYSYSAISGDGQTLTGLSGLPAFTAGTVVIQAVVTTTNTPTNGTNFSNDFIKTIGNQLYVGSYSSRVVYVSSDSDYTDYSVPSPPLYGSPDQQVMDQLVNGIGVHDGNPHIFSGTSQVTEVTYYDVNIDENVGNVAYTILTRGTKLSKTIMPTLFSALAHEFIDSIGNDIVFLSQDQQVRVLGLFKDMFGNPKYPSISQNIQDELKTIDFTGGHLRAIGEYIYVTSPKTGIYYLHQTRESVNENGVVVAERLWHSPHVSNVSRMAVISGTVYGHSNANPQIYQIYDTNQWHDDSPSNTPIPYNSVAMFAYQHLAEKKQFRRQGFLKWSRLYTEGYMAPGSLLYCNALYNYQGSSQLLNLLINTILSPATFFVGENAPSLGQDSMGDNPLGDGLVQSLNGQDQLSKFYSINKATLVNCFEYALQYYSEDVDARWELIAIGTNLQLVDAYPVNIQH